jgi:predicted MFS family arabinose efflux permease
MFSVLSHPIYRRLFTAQVVSILGTGLSTVALGFLALEISALQAGMVLGTAFAIRMVANVAVTLAANALLMNVPRMRLLSAMDLTRAALVLVFPFVNEVWQIYLLVFVIQSASAVASPLMQATVAETVKGEADYGRALSMTRFAYDIELVISPVLAAALLVITDFEHLFAGTAAGFILSGLILARTPVSADARTGRREAISRIVMGIRAYVDAPALRSVLVLNFAAAGALCTVLVNTVVLTQVQLGLGQSHTALAIACYGAGSMAFALALPWLSTKISDRSAMLGGALLIACTLLTASLLSSYSMLCFLWFFLGVGHSAIQTSSGRVIRASGDQGLITALFVANFSLTHAVRLSGYLIAGWLGAQAGVGVAMCAAGVIAMAAFALALVFWRTDRAGDHLHRHDDLAADHPHLLELPTVNGFHRHKPVWDQLHRAPLTVSRSASR